MEQEMKYIYAVYRHASFSKAAEALYMTQPALSIAVQRVETRVGMPLFDRTTKPVKLTEAGELYIRKYKEIENLENELAQQLNDLSGLQTGLLRVGGSHYFNAYILPSVLAEYAKQYPGIRLELTEAGSGELLRMLYDHDIDITFNCDLAPKDTFLRKPCFEDRVLLAVPKHLPVNEALRDCAMTAREVMDARHLSREQSGVNLSAFSQTPFILLAPGNNLFSRSTALFEQAGIQPRVLLHVTQLVTAWRLAAAGMGATFISDFLVTGDAPDVLFYKLDSPIATRVFDMVMSDRHYVSHAMRAFEALFVAHSF